MCDVVKHCVEAGVQVGIVVGGGNIWRGLKDGGDRMERTRADHMGMLATVINCAGPGGRLEQRDAPAGCRRPCRCPRWPSPTSATAPSHLEKGRVVIFGCGTGNPYFSTDTGAVLRGIEINADVSAAGQEHRRRL